MSFQLVPISILPGVDKDNTPLYTQHFTDGKNLRFYNGLPEKLGGWRSMSFDNSNTIGGVPRTIYSQIIPNNTWTFIGTNTRLYALLGTTLTNITPLVTSTTAIANSLATNYTTLSNNPFTTVNGSTTVTVTHTAHKLVAGDTVIFSGAATTNGIPSGNLNASQVIRSTTTNTYTIIVATAATSSGSGGGASVVEATNIITVTQAAHGFSNGDRVKILAASATGGVPAGEINLEHILRNVSVNNYDFVCTTQATSSVSAAGGASTTVQGQIAAGSVNELLGIGYGMGKYGVGLYGVAKMSPSLLTQPRIWGFARFGNNMLATPGNQTGLYQWTGATITAPTLLTNAPTAINYVFVSNNIIVTMGASNTPNRLQWCDQGASTVWTATAQNQAGQDDVEGADQWLSQINIRGINLIFTNKQLWTMQYIGKPLIWQVDLLDDVAGIISQNAVCSHAGIAYWMGNEDFYMYNGGVVQSIPSNSETGVNYIKNYVFNNLNNAQSAKCFAWYNKTFKEVWFHYPSANSNECDSVARFNVAELHWTPDTISRSAAESPHIATQYPKLCNYTGTLYQHELGNDDNVSPMSFSVKTKFFEGNTDLIEIGGVIPDSIQTGDITLTTTTKLYPQDSSSVTVTNTITSTSGNVTLLANGRHWQYQISQSVLGGYWRAGKWMQYVQEGAYQ